MSCPHGNHPDACDICDEVAAAYNSGVEHTKREWVGLTRDEVDTYHVGGMFDSEWEIYKRVEAKMKELNT
jgi:hypothetical protein